jgi:hypothetical protein
MQNSPAGIILTTAYFPPVDYFILAAGTGRVMIEMHENYSKQSYRNRCNIMSANGILPLVIPVKRFRGRKTPITEVRPDNHYNWQKLHMISIRSAYRAAPFYEFYADEIMPFFKASYESLLDLNAVIFEKMLELLEIKVSWDFTREFTHTAPRGFTDGREIIHPKKRYSPFTGTAAYPEYPQVFRDRQGFIPGLSILDLLFNAGPGSGGLLMEAATKLLPAFGLQSNGRAASNPE